MKNPLSYLDRGFLFGAFTAAFYLSFSIFSVPFTSTLGALFLLANTVFVKKPIKNVIRISMIRGRLKVHVRKLMGTLSMF